METFMERMRNRRQATRRARAINRALRAAPSAAMRKELMDLASRYE